MKLEFPLNDALPNTDHARDRLLAKIFRFRKTEDVANDTKDEDYALLYAYGEEDVLPNARVYLLTLYAKQH